MTRDEIIQALKALLDNTEEGRLWMETELLRALLRELRIKARADTQIVYNFLEWLPTNVMLIDDNGSEYGEDWSPLDDKAVMALLNEWCDPAGPPTQVDTVADAMHFISQTGATVTQTVVKNNRLQFTTDRGEVHVRERVG